MQNGVKERGLLVSKPLPIQNFGFVTNSLAGRKEK